VLCSALSCSLLTPCETRLMLHRFGGTCWLHLQAEWIWCVWMLKWLEGANLWIVWGRCQSCGQSEAGKGQIFAFIQNKMRTFLVTMRSASSWAKLIHPEDGGSTSLRNVGTRCKNHQLNNTRRGNMKPCIKCRTAFRTICL
jgi:hypothetical protein